MSEELFHALTADFGHAAKAAELDLKTASDIRASLFPKQRAILEDPSPIKAALCPRRAGKSWTALAYAHEVSLKQPGSMSVVVCLTLKHCKTVYWNSVLPRFQRLFGVQTFKHHTDMRLTFANSSMIHFVGAETKAEIEKLRGGSFDLIVIDECKSFPPDLLRELVFDVCYPACSDRDGTILMIGTPGSILEGPFYEGTYRNALNERNEPYSRTFDDPEHFWLTNPTRTDWLYSRHSWTVRDNVYAPSVWERALKQKQASGWADDHPTWLREWLGQWVSADDVFVYAYTGLRQKDPSKVQWYPGPRDQNNRHGLPAGHDWRFVLGLDLGFEDDFAMVVGAYSLTDGSLYHVYDYKVNHQDVDQVAAHVLRVIEMFNGKVDAIVADSVGLGKMVVETLNRRHGLSIVPAEKPEKNDFIELLNADFLSGRIKIQPDSDLDTELRMLQWDLTKHSRKELVRAGKLREHPGLPNHLCDALLYLWRYSYHTYAAAPVNQLQPGTSDWFERWERDSIQRLMDRDLTDRGIFAELNERSYDPLEAHYERYRA